MATNNSIHSDLAIPPGEYLEEVLGELGMTKSELARRMSRPATKLSPIFRGAKAITPDTALQLEKVVGVPAHIWTGLEAEYRLTLARQEEAQHQQRLRDEAQLVTPFCYSELVKAGEVRRHTKPTDRVLELQKFFGVTTLKRVRSLRRYEAFFRSPASGRAGRTPQAVAAWLRLGERRAQAMDCAAFDKARLMSTLGDVRAMTLQQPDEFLERLRNKLAACGVALVVCPHFAKARAYGATFWQGPDTAVLMITIRGKWADIFWFSLLHEIGHLLKHGRQTVILEDDTTNDRETEADTFAANTLIPPRDYARFVSQGSFYQSDIEVFARQVGVHPGIVVGRLQHDRRLRPNWQNRLRVRYEWAQP